MSRTATDTSRRRRRCTGMHPMFRLLAGILITGSTLGTIHAEIAGAANGRPSCSLKVEAIDDTSMTLRYRSPDGITRTAWVNGQPYTIAAGNSVTTPLADTFDWPTIGNTVSVAEVLRICGDPRPQPTTTTSTTVQPTTTTSTTQPTTTTSSTSTTVQPTTTTAQARPAIVCPTGSALRLSTTDGRNRDGVYDMPAIIGGVRRETTAGEPVWVSVWTFDRPTQVETWGAVTADCIPMVPPTTVVTATTPAPSTSLPPATSTSVELLPPVTVPGTPTTVGLPRLPETGRNTSSALLLGGVLAVSGAAALVAQRMVDREND